MRINLAVVAMAVGAVLAGCAYSSLPKDFSLVTVDGGQFLADDLGRTLYVFDLDLPGASNCYQDCAANWPPHVAGAQPMASGDFTLVPRKDGFEQWAYKDQPLYRYQRDRAPGDRNGEGARNVWHMVRMGDAGAPAGGNGGEGGY